MDIIWHMAYDKISTLVPTSEEECKQIAFNLVKESFAEKVMALLPQE